MNNIKDTLLAQYANSPTIVGLIERFNDSIDPSVDIQAFYDQLWNIDTANTAGLDNWGKIVNVSRYLQVDQQSTYFGFGESASAQPFNQAPFWDGPPATTTYRLSDPAYRKLIMLKAMSNISNCSIPTLNKMLMYIYGDRGRCYVQDTGGMSVRIVFEFPLQPVDVAIILSSGAIARPSGVSLSMILLVSRTTTFGFAEANGQAFGHGTFLGNNGAIYAV